MSPSDIELWLRHPTTYWFITNLGTRFGNVDQLWRSVSTVESLHRLRGIAEVMDVINGMLKDPETFD